MMFVDALIAEVKASTEPVLIRMYHRHQELEYAILHSALNLPKVTVVEINIYKHKKCMSSS